MKGTRDCTSVHLYRSYHMADSSVAVTMCMLKNRYCVDIRYTLPDKSTWSGYRWDDYTYAYRWYWCAYIRFRLS